MRRIVALLLALCAVAAHAATPADVSAYLAARVSGTHVPGLVAMVVDAHGTRYVGAFGRQDVAGNIPMREDTIFRIASMTKPVTSLAVMMLVEEGKVALDDPIERYLPQYADPQVIESFFPLERAHSTRPAAHSITVRHLLAHTSGLAYPFTSATLTQLQGSGEGARPLPSPTPLLHDPGAMWTYGESTRVLGLLVEKVGGVPLESFLSQRIFGPLGMDQTGYAVPAALRWRVATVHRRVEGKLVETPNPAEVSAPANGDGGLHSTADDYAKFIRLFLNEGRAPDGRQLVQPATIRSMGVDQLGAVRVRLMESVSPALSAAFPLGAGRDGFGLGFQVTAGPGNDGMRSAGSLSWAGIFNTQFWIDPVRGVGGILLMQYLPFYDQAAIDTLLGFERLAYSLAP
jgi:CubicO group peptidase (beta-lactamase class C family)